MRFLSGVLAVSLAFLLLGSVAFAARLPAVGLDTNTWGTFLNEYLLVEHNINGTHTNITAQIVNASDQICIGADCRTTWPAGSGINDNTTLTNLITGNNNTLAALLGQKVNLTQLNGYLTASDNTTLTDSINLRLLITAWNSENTTIGATYFRISSWTSENTTINNLYEKISAHLSDNTTLSDRIGSFLTTSDNTTIFDAINTKANQTDLFNNATRIELIAGRQSSDNTTVSAYMGTKLNLTTNTLGQTLSILGTNMSNNLTLNVNNTLYVNASANRIGIGTNAPTSKLHVIGDINITNITLASNCADGQVLKWLNGVGQCGTDNSGGSSAGGGWTNDSETTSTTLSVNAASGKFFVNATTGDVGIGTTTPLSRLHVAGNGSITGTLLVEDINVTGRQIADNATLGNKIAALQTDNTTIFDAINTKANQSDLFNNATRIESLWSRHTADNTTIQNTYLKISSWTSDNNTIRNALNTKFNTTSWNSENTTIGATYFKISDWTAENTTINNLYERITVHASDNTTITALLEQKANITQLSNYMTTNDNTTLTASIGTKVNLTQLSGYMTTSDNTTIFNSVNTKANQSDLFNNASRIEGLYSRQSSDNTTLLDLNSANNNTISSNLTSIGTRIGTLEIKQSSDNTTLSNRMGSFLTTSDNTTLTDSINLRLLITAWNSENTTIGATYFKISSWTSENTTINNLYEKISAHLSDNTTLSDRIGSFLTTSDNTTMFNLISTKANQTDLFNNATRIELIAGRQSSDNTTLKNYIDSQDGTKLNLTGGNVSGATNLATSGGYVGIGTTTPSTKLDVIGNITVNGSSISSSSGITLRNETGDLFCITVQNTTLVAVTGPC